MFNDEVLKPARQSLLDRVAAIDRVRLGDALQRDFTFKQIKAGIDTPKLRYWITSSLGEDINCAAIYRLTVHDQDGADRLRLAFKEYERPSGVKLTRNNEVDKSKTVYVGSSRTIRTRLPQHLNDCAAGTYALKMQRWCPDAEYSLRLEVTVVPGQLNTALVQDLEDALWTSSRPMFGKLGPR